MPARDVLLFLLELSSNVVSSSSAQFASTIAAWLMVVIKEPWGDRIHVLAARKSNNVTWTKGLWLCLYEVYNFTTSEVTAKRYSSWKLSDLMWSYDCVLYHLGTNIHECNRGLGDSDSNATCINTFGSWLYVQHWVHWKWIHLHV